MSGAEWLHARLSQANQLGAELDTAKSNDAELAAQEKELIKALETVKNQRREIASRNISLQTQLETLFVPPSHTSGHPAQHGKSTSLFGHRSHSESSAAAPYHDAMDGSGTNGQRHNAIRMERTSSMYRDTSYSPDAASETIETQGGYPILNDQYSNVVRIDGKVVAISCFVRDCKANCTSHSNRSFFRGVPGLRTHITQMHSEFKGIDLDEVARRCVKDVLSEQEVRMLERGLLPKTRIAPSYGLNDPRHSNGSPDRPTHLNELPYINSRYRHIIKIKGVWTELACNVDGCGANFSKSGGSFFNGFKGFHNHISQAHGLRGLKAEEALKHCSQRVVSGRDVALMGSARSLEPEDHVPQKKPYENDLTESFHSHSPDVASFRRSTRDADAILGSSPDASMANGRKRSADVAGLLERFSTPQTGQTGFFRPFSRPENTRTSLSVANGKLSVGKAPAGKAPAGRAPSIEDSLKDLRERRTIEIDEGD